MPIMKENNTVCPPVFGCVIFYNQWIQVHLVSDIEVVSSSLQILSVLLRNVAHTLSHSDIVSVARVAHGYVGGDLSAVCREGKEHAEKCANFTFVKEEETLQYCV